MKTAIVTVVWLVARTASAERLVVPTITSPPELADEAGAIELLVKSSLGKLTLVDAPATGTPQAAGDHAVLGALARNGTGLDLDVTIVGHDGTRDAVTIHAGDGDVVALARGMVDKIGDTTHTTTTPVRPFALGALRPYASALHLVKTDPAGAIARLDDAEPVVALGVPAIRVAFGDLLTVATSPISRLVIARAIGATDVVATIASGRDSVAATARAFAAIDRSDLATAETALLNVTGGLASLGRAAIAAAHDDVRLGAWLDQALQSDQRRAALALAATLVPAHVPASVHRTLLPLAERAAQTSPGVASRIGLSAAQAKVEPGRALALVSIRDLDQYAIDGMPAMLDLYRDIPKSTLLRLRAELAMRKGEPAQAAIDAYLSAAPAEARAQQYAAWSKAPPRRSGASPVAPTAAPADDDFVKNVNVERSSTLDRVLPLVAGVGVLVLIGILVFSRRKRRPLATVVIARPPKQLSSQQRRAAAPESIAISEAPARSSRSANDAPAAVKSSTGRLKIDVTTHASVSPLGADPFAGQPALPPAPAAGPGPTTSLGRTLPASSHQAELGDRLQGLIDVELPPDEPVIAREPVARATHAPAPIHPKPMTLPPPIEVASASRSPLDVDRATPMPMRARRASALEVDAGPLDGDPFGLGAPVPAPAPVALRTPAMHAPVMHAPALASAPVAKREFMGPPASHRASSGLDFELDTPDLMPLGSDPRIALGGGSTSKITPPAVSSPALDIQLGNPSGEFEHPNLAKPGERDLGKPLAAMLAERGELPWLEAVGIIDQICAGLAYAHARGIAHGAVRPTSIFVAGRVSRLGAFGTALALGKPPQPADDVYELGMTLAEMLGPDLGDAPPRLIDLVSALRAHKLTQVGDVRAAFKALFDF